MLPSQYQPSPHSSEHNYITDDLDYSSCSGCSVVHGSVADGAALSRSYSLEPICEALCHHDYARAAALLEESYSKAHNCQQPPLLLCGCEDRRVQADHSLWLASLYALYKDRARSYYYLQQSQAVNSGLASNILYKALIWEHDAHVGRDKGGHPIGTLQLGALGTPQGDDYVARLIEAIHHCDFANDLGSILARHHAARALCVVGAYSHADALLEQQEVSHLEPWLLWQHYRLSAQVQQMCGHLMEALEDYQHALAVAPQEDKLELSLNIASLYLQYQRPRQALELLSTNTSHQILTPQARALEGCRYYLMAHAQLKLVNLQQARLLLWQAQQHYAQQDIYLLLAQVNMQLADVVAAVKAYQWAWAAPCYASYLSGQEITTSQPQHYDIYWQDIRNILPLPSVLEQRYGYALALSKTGALELAQQELQQLLVERNVEQMLKGKIYALLAEISLHQGQQQASYCYAQQAISLDAVYHGYRILGQLALESYDLARAIECFEYAVSGVARGSAPWLDMSCLLVDTLSKVKGDTQRIYLRASDILMMMEQYAPQHPWREEMLRQQENAASQQAQQRLLILN